MMRLGLLLLLLLLPMLLLLLLPLLLIMLRLLLLLLPLETTSAADVGAGPTCVVASSCVPPDSTGAADRVVAGALMV